MVQAMSENKALPAYLGKLNRFGSPGNAIIVVNLVSASSLILGETFTLKMEWLIEMPNGSFLTVYTLASLAAWHLLKGKVRYLAIPALMACTFIALQIGESMLFAFVMLGSAYLFSLLKANKTAIA